MYKQWLELGTKTTWLGLGKNHGLDSNKHLADVGKKHCGLGCGCNTKHIYGHAWNNIDCKFEIGTARLSPLLMYY